MNRLLLSLALLAAIPLCGMEEKKPKPSWEDNYKSALHEGDNKKFSEQLRIALIVLNQNIQQTLGSTLSCLPTQAFKDTAQQTLESFLLSPEDHDYWQREVETCREKAEKSYGGKTVGGCSRKFWLEQKKIALNKITKHDQITRLLSLVK